MAIALGACSPEPRYGEATVSAEAPRVTVTGTTFGQAAALELAPGCPGYLDVETPGHVLHVTDEVPFTVQVRSDDGPLALAVTRGDEVRCDSDEGAGHAPTLSFEGAGDYEVFVAALRGPAELAYTLRTEAQTAGAPGAEADARESSVTVTSDPPGAEVRDETGALVGTTPTMFVVPLEEDEVGQERTWRLTLDGHAPTEVGGALSGGAITLHAQLPALGPTEIEVSSTEAQPIRDYQSAAMAVQVAERCAITEAEVEVDIRHSFIGDLRVVLEPPSGDAITLHRHRGGGRRNLRRSWDSDDALSALVGTTTRGRWTLTVHDDAGADQGSLERFDLRLTCAPPGGGSPAGVADDAGEATPAATDRRRAGRPARGRRGYGRRRASPSPLPDLPTRTEIVRVLGALRPQAERCARGDGGSARVMLTVQGSTGRVTQVSSSGTASGAERACVERVVRGARFSRFRRASLDVDYTYDLSGAAAPAPQRPDPRPHVIEPW